MGTFQIDFGDSAKPPEHIIGIDLGTTNSLVAFMDLTGPKIVGGILPSVVGLSTAGDIVVGNPACDLLLTLPDRAIYSVKRLMGRGLADVTEELKLFPFRVASEGSDQVLKLKLGPD